MNTDVPTAAEIFGAESSLMDGPREFQRIDEGSYRLGIRHLGIEFTVDRLRRKWDELVGELTVRCQLAGARTHDGVLSVGDFNLSTQRSREDRARYLATRANAKDLDWGGLLEEFVQRVLAAERTGQPAVSLRTLPRPSVDDTVEIDGVPMVDRHPIILFGDGGAAKSYLALYLAGQMAMRGVRPALFDWELSGEDHRERLERLFGPEMPEIQYVRCTRPLVDEADRLRRIVREEEIGYAFYDSVAFASDGPPEAAEVAARYFQAVRQIGVGSCHVAHVTKAQDGDQRPFGSAFWHNGARATWNVKLGDTLPGSNQITIGLYNRKSNLSGLRPAVAFEIAFDAERTSFRPVQVADVAELASVLPLRQRIQHLLRGGARTIAAIADELDAKPDTVKKTLDRHRTVFARIIDTPDGIHRYGISELRRVK